MCSFCMSAVTQGVFLLSFSVGQFLMYCTPPCYPKQMRDLCAVWFLWIFYSSILGSHSVFL